MYVRMNVHMYVCVCMYVHTYVHMHTYIHMYVCIHTYICMHVAIEQDKICSDITKMHEIISNNYFILWLMYVYHIAQFLAREILMDLALS